MTDHESYYEWDGSGVAVHCRCRFYRWCESQDVAEAEYRNHIDVGWAPYRQPQPQEDT